MFVRFGLPTVIYGGVISAIAAKLGAALPQGGSEPNLTDAAAWPNVNFLSLVVAGIAFSPLPYPAQRH